MSQAQKFTAPAKTTKAKAPRSRPTAKEQTRRRRKSRIGSDASMLGPLAIDVDALDKDFEYRWIRNTPERIATLTKQDDWDLVDDNEGTHATTGEDSRVRRPSGATGMVLARKRKEYFEEDQRLKIAKAEETAKRVKSGDAGNELGSQGYIPTSGISVKDA